MIVVSGEGGGELVCRVALSREGDGGGEMREDAGSSMTDKPEAPLIVECAVAVKWLFGVGDAGVREVLVNNSRR